MCILIHCLQGKGLCSIGACAKAFATPDPFLPCFTLTKSLKDSLGRDRLSQCAALSCRKAMSFNKRLAVPQSSCLVPLQRRVQGLSVWHECWQGQTQFPKC